ncbi:MAG TPA: MASE4 domain-containing protein, partial [Pyrinomonadaceae bacterium]|nr:MASE4 domain-containing protein [Pyrinomonadaceae bacterium]
MQTAAAVSDEEQLILSSVSPGAAQKRMALAVVLGMLIVFVLITAGPLGSSPTNPVAAFVPAYATAMFVCDSITAILLFAQFSILRSRAILVIASGYLFTALILIPWILAFPGVFTPGAGLIGGLQTTSWLYFAQHAGLPLFAIVYALSKDTDADKLPWPHTTRSAIALSVALTAGLVSAVAFICVAGEASLPRVVLDSLHLSPLWPYAGAPVALLSLAGLIVLWIRGRSLLDLWLMVVMCLYTLEIPLSYYPTPIRFSIGWYAVRVIGFLSSTLVLTVLLYEIQAIYAKLFDIEDRRRGEEVLQANERNLSLIINTIPAHIYVLNTEGYVQYVNQAVMEFTGLSIEDVQQADYRDRVIHPADFKRVREPRAAGLRRGVPFSTEQRVLRNDGQYRWFLVRYRPLHDEQGRIVRWYVAAFDVEDQKRAEAEVEKAYLRLAQAQQVSKTGSFITDLL